MKHFLLTLFCCLICACHTLPIYDAPRASYIITMYKVDGAVAQSYNVRTYKETEFPRTVTFTDSMGKSRIITGSYEIDITK